CDNRSVAVEIIDKCPTCLPTPDNGSLAVSLPTLSTLLGSTSAALAAGVVKNASWELFPCSSNPNEGDGGGNGAVVGGIVGGIVAVLVVIGGGWFVYKRRQRNGGEGGTGSKKQGGDLVPAIVPAKGDPLFFAAAGSGGSERSGESGSAVVVLPAAQQQNVSAAIDIPAQEDPVPEKHAVPESGGGLFGAMSAAVVVGSSGVSGVKEDVAERKAVEALGVAGFETVDPGLWNVEHVCAWLESMHYGEDVVDKFREKECTGRDLQTMSVSDDNCFDVLTSQYLIPGLGMRFGLAQQIRG
ncbi:hypothetical protein HDU98_005205, partial [Podochytrium sp. JEL0797]